MPGAGAAGGLDADPLGVDSVEAAQRAAVGFVVRARGLGARAYGVLGPWASWLLGKVLGKDLARLDRDDPHFGLAARLHNPAADPDCVFVEWQTPLRTRSRFSGEPALATSLFTGYTRLFGRLDGRRVARRPPAVARLRQWCDAYRTPIAWEAGDVIMVDNTRMMHGRERFTDAPGARRHVRTRYGLCGPG